MKEKLPFDNTIKDVLLRRLFGLRVISDTICDLELEVQVEILPNFDRIQFCRDNNIPLSEYGVFSVSVTVRYFDCDNQPSIFCGMNLNYYTNKSSQWLGIPDYLRTCFITVDVANKIKKFVQDEFENRDIPSAVNDKLLYNVS